MDILIEKFYRLELTNQGYVNRKIKLDGLNYQINGISLSGKTKIIKSYLLTCKKQDYLYIDLKDIRIDVNTLNTSLQSFCDNHHIKIMVLDNYHDKVIIPKVQQIIICCRKYQKIDFLTTKIVYPLDFEEFLAFSNRYDSIIFSDFLYLGGFASLRHVPQDEQAIYIQYWFKQIFTPIQFAIMKLVSTLFGQTLSAFNLYERLKKNMKLSKDLLYISYRELLEQNYLLPLSKFGNNNATKKIYLCDIIFKHALTVEKNFAKLFENVVFLELFKHDVKCFYAQKIDFYIPDANKIILCMPFSDESALFKRVEAIEAFIFSYQVINIECITMNHEGAISHPISNIIMIPFVQWALGD